MQEEARRAEEAKKKAEETKKADEARKAEEAKKKEEEKRKKDKAVMALPVLNSRNQRRVILFVNSLWLL